MINWPWKKKDTTLPCFTCKSVVEKDEMKTVKYSGVSMAWHYDLNRYFCRSCNPPFDKVYIVPVSNVTEYYQGGKKVDVHGNKV